MDYYNDISRSWEYPAYEDLSDELVSAVCSGSMEKTMIALDAQECNETTINLSNHLAARGLWVGHKTRLSSACNTLLCATTIEEVIKEVQLCIKDLETRFTDTIVSDDEENRYEKVSHDDLFREVVSTSKESARYLIAIDSNQLLSPKDFHHYIACLHHEVVQALENAPAQARMVDIRFENELHELHELVGLQIKRLDQELLDGLHAVSNHSLL